MFPTESQILAMSQHILPFHDHPLSYSEDFNNKCDLCFGWGSNSKTGRMSYYCSECRFSLHKECVDRLLNKPFHCSHFLKIFKRTSGDTDLDCHFCRNKILDLFAHCGICNISISPTCLERRTTPRTIYQPKHHKHNFILLPRLVTFTCNACGEEGDRNPYVCYKCNLMIHKDCIDLPRVININRHDHRISHTFHLGQGEGDWECKVCRKTINWVYGGFSCSRCLGYAVHSKCATRTEVWDGNDLEDVPEEEEEIEDPFKVINGKDIIHFSHEDHILRFSENYVNMRCGACILPINGDPCYKCEECDFILHKACANLPRKKRHPLHKHRLILRVSNGGHTPFRCIACETFSNGFVYACEKNEFLVLYDVRCASLSEPFRHDLHEHPLYWTLEGSKRCNACNKEIKDPLRCIKSEYALCIGCATLPKKVKHRCDDHILSLCQGAENSSGDLWCDICETKTDPEVCYYTCEECGLSLHTNCVVGDFYYVKEGEVEACEVHHFEDSSFELLPNSGATRPICSICEVRCKFPFLVRETGEGCVGYICSRACHLQNTDWIHPDLYFVSTVFDE